MVGSLDEAEDLVQETMLRAWRARDSFAGRASLRTWLYKIATNACLDALEKRSRRSLPPRVYPSSDPNLPVEFSIADPAWIDPYPDALMPQATADPEARYAAHESVSLAFLVALQVLSGRQRAVLILRDVLDWRATEVAQLLDTSVSAVNSMVHRARAALATNYDRERRRPDDPLDTESKTLLERYVRAWETADVAGLVALLKRDAVFAMPPSSTWVRGRDAVRVFAASKLFEDGSAERWRMVQTRANGQPAFGLYQLDKATGRRLAVGVQVLSLDDSTGVRRVAEITTFIVPQLAEPFGLPAELKQ